MPNGGARVVAQAGEIAVATDRFANAPRDFFGREKIDEQAIVPIFNHFAHRLGVRCDHEATGCHRLKERP